MAITTKKGDGGMTSLYGGVRVSKDHKRLEACGSLDELCSFLGLSKSLTKDKAFKKMLASIQEDLFVICSELATSSKFLHKLKTRIDKTHVARLERFLANLESKKIPGLRGFRIPGDNLLSSSLDICRTVARRSERHTVALKRKRLLLNKLIIIYLNRLSDLLFLLARRYDRRKNG
ncbi:MAG: ATP:cob(I)alamin adenosyltransferase [Omnitrophica WOR_2 bacterium RBG_13_44_8b]|nr:MAG: ATP:cob(I)alamin adenosyltransferase [Omnitrophica WOR_2 bacterium RBG_13_44_8b]